MTRLGGTREVVLPFPEPLVQATSFRSTWLASSLAGLRDVGVFSSYLAELPREYHDAVTLSVAGTWLPVEVATAHYEACERVGMSMPQLTQVCRTVTQRVHGTSLSTLVRLAKTAGVTPWHALAHLNRLWERVWRGGGVRVTKLAEKDALIEFAAWPIAHLPYMKKSMPLVSEAVLELFCRKVFTRLVKTQQEGQLVVQANWV